MLPQYGYPPPYGAPQGGYPRPPQPGAPGMWGQPPAYPGMMPPQYGAAPSPQWGGYYGMPPHMQQPVQRAFTRAACAVGARDALTRLRA